MKVSEKAQTALAEMLAEWVAWQGHEQIRDQLLRCQRAEQLLKRLAPEILAKHKAAVKAAGEE